MAVSLSGINRLSGDIEAVLFRNNLIKDAIRIKHCFGYKQCQDPYCIRCTSRRAYIERRHLSIALTTLLDENPRYQLWMLTGTAADSPDVRTSALAAVRGMKRLLKHPRLKGRVIAHFSALEVADKSWREHPCAHVHSLVVTKPMDKGKYRISRRDWVAMWEDACPQHRIRVPTSKRRRPMPPKTKSRRSAPASAKRRRGDPQPREHPSLKADLVPREPDHILRVVNYCTKWAATRRVVSDYRRLLGPNPLKFLDRIAALKGVTKFFGSLHIMKARKAAPCELGS
jgi:hypothetical protein